MFDGYGILHYYPTWWLIVRVPGDVCKYYRKLVFYNRFLRLNPSKCESHITIVAGKYERPDEAYASLWGKYEGERIEFKYSPEIDTNDEYFWAKVECKRIEDIREEMGLPPKILYPWHLTIGNII